VSRLTSALVPDGSQRLGRHVDALGPLVWPQPAGALLGEIERSGLRGRGGAWFPVATKWRSVTAGRRRPVVVANGAESEPASAKDRLLLHEAPHVVLDGLSVAGVALDAARLVVYLPERLSGPVRSALAERRRHSLDPVEIELADAPERFTAGQESAVVSTINGGQPGRPIFTGLHPVRERGVDGRPTVVQNVETLGHVALIARFGAPWYREVGTPACTGTTLLTVHGRQPGARVVEAALGDALSDAIALGPEEADGFQGVLLGGYGGAWVPMTRAQRMLLSEEGARQVGGVLGAGVVALLPRAVCPLGEMARVVAYMEAEGAGQCGPCVNGLHGLARALRDLATRPRGLRRRLDPLLTLCKLIEGRGACRHPDGVVRFVRSGLETFDGDVQAHLRQGPCGRPYGFLPLPPHAGEPW
jgi:NADH:ubiquinone oxidoreductase subunit F (NADH-binding)